MKSVKLFFLLTVIYFFNCSLGIAQETDKLSNEINNNRGMVKSNEIQNDKNNKNLNASKGRSGSTVEEAEESDSVDANKNSLLPNNPCNSSNPPLFCQ